MKKKMMIFAVLLVCVVTFANAYSSTRVFYLDFVEHNDGCCFLPLYGHYFGIGRRTNSSFGSSAPTHRNDNAYINNELDRFYSEVRRLNAVDEDHQPSRGTYYVYRISKESYHYVGNSFVRGDYDAIIPRYTYIIWRVVR